MRTPRISHTSFSHSFWDHCILNLFTLQPMCLVSMMPIQNQYWIPILVTKIHYARISFLFDIKENNHYQEPNLIKTLIHYQCDFNQSIRQKNLWTVKHHVKIPILIIYVKPINQILSKPCNYFQWSNQNNILKWKFQSPTNISLVNTFTFSIVSQIFKLPCSQNSPSSASCM